MEPRDARVGIAFHHFETPLCTFVIGCDAQLLGKRALDDVSRHAVKVRTEPAAHIGGTAYVGAARTDIGPEACTFGAIAAPFQNGWDRHVRAARAGGRVPGARRRPRDGAPRRRPAGSRLR